MAKRFYKKGEMIYIKTLKKKGKIRELDIKNQFIVASYWNDNSEIEKGKFTFQEIDKLREKEAIVVSENQLLWAKVKPQATIPTKRLEDGCYDIYACVNENIVIKPHQIVEVPTGIASAFHSNYRLDFQRERGSTGSIGLAPRCGQVDSGYRGEIFLKLQNVTDKTIVLYVGEGVNGSDNDFVYYPLTKAVCQAALEIVPVVEEKEISYEELSKIPSERGTGRLGSSKK
jgi:dUTP pyrophosphatase